MKKWLLIVGFTFSATLCFAQKHLLSYDDIRFLLINNLQRADTFMMAKGYSVTNNSVKSKNRSYQSKKSDDYVNVDMRIDGKRLFVEILTNEIEQYDLIHNSIAQYIRKDGMSGDVQVYVVKDLGTIYITTNDTAPYNPLKLEYDIHIVADKHITAYN